MEITWREFEKLVTKLENALSPIGADIKSPDKIEDKITGRLREVDGSIRFKNDKKEILITIECRRRNQKEDITWIEQLVTKKKNIEADKTIAVSSKGFSQSAEKLAEQNDIVLKSLIDINPVKVTEWLIPKSIVNLFRNISLISLTASYIEGDEEKEFKTDRLENCNFLDKYRRHIPIPSILRSAEDYLSAYKPEILFSPPLDGSSKDRISLGRPLAKGEMYLNIEEDTFLITKIHVTIDLGYLHAITDIEHGRHYVYDSDKNRFQVSEFDSTNDQLPFTFAHMIDTNSKELKSSLELRKLK